MKKVNFKQTFISGLFFALPIIGIFFIGLRIVSYIKEIIGPIANKFGITHLLGELTLTIFAFVILLFICFILGLLLRAKVLQAVNKQIEELAFKFVPTLYELKALASEDERNKFEHGWKTVLLMEDEKWVPAYITDENTEWLTVFFPHSPEIKNGHLKLIKTSTAAYRVIDGMKFRFLVKHYGKGMAETVSSPFLGRRSIVQP